MNKEIGQRMIEKAIAITGIAWPPRSHREVRPDDLTVNPPAARRGVQRFSPGRYRNQLRKSRSNNVGHRTSLQIGNLNGDLSIRRKLARRIRAPYGAKLRTKYHRRVSGPNRDLVRRKTGSGKRRTNKTSGQNKRYASPHIRQSTAFKTVRPAPSLTQCP